MSNLIEFGLVSAPAVRWLIGEEKQVYDRVIAFFMGDADTDIVEVVGPPSEEDLAKARKAGHGDSVPMPVIRLQMKLAENQKTGEHGVAVTCSDRDMLEIERWERLAMLANLKIGKAN